MLKIYLSLICLIIGVSLIGFVIYYHSSKSYLDDTSDPFTFVKSKEGNSPILPVVAEKDINSKPNLVKNDICTPDQKIKCKRRVDEKRESLERCSVSPVNKIEKIEPVSKPIEIQQKVEQKGDQDKGKNSDLSNKLKLVDHKVDNKFTKSESSDKPQKKSSKATKVEKPDTKVEQKSIPLDQKPEIKQPNDQKSEPKPERKPERKQEQKHVDKPETQPTKPDITRSEQKQNQKAQQKPDKNLSDQKLEITAEKDTRPKREKSVPTLSQDFGPEIEKTPKKHPRKYGLSDNSSGSEESTLTDSLPQSHSPKAHHRRQAPKKKQLNYVVKENQSVTFQSATNLESTTSFTEIKKSSDKGNSPSAGWQVVPPKVIKPSPNKVFSIPMNTSPQDALKSRPRARSTEDNGHSSPKVAYNSSLYNYFQAKRKLFDEVPESDEEYQYMKTRSCPSYSDMNEWIDVL